MHRAVSISAAQTLTGFPFPVAFVRLVWLLLTSSAASLTTSWSGFVSGPLESLSAATIWLQSAERCSVHIWQWSLASKWAEQWPSSCISVMDQPSTGQQWHHRACQELHLLKLHGDWQWRPKTRDDLQKSSGGISPAITLETILAASQHLTQHKVPNIQLHSSTARRHGP